MGFTPCQLTQERCLTYCKLVIVSAFRRTSTAQHFRCFSCAQNPACHYSRQQILAHKIWGFETQLDAVPSVAMSSHQVIVQEIHGRYSMYIKSAINLVGQVYLMSDDQAINLERDGLALCPDGHPDRAIFCGNLTSFLHTRYQRTADDVLLDEAIVLRREAHTLRPEGHPDRAQSCTDLADLLWTRYESTGGDALLDESIVLRREALALRPEGHPDRAESREGLANSLERRYKRTGDVSQNPEFHAQQFDVMSRCKQGFRRMRSYEDAVQQAYVASAGMSMFYHPDLLS
jgi:hypothetical protein